MKRKTLKVVRKGTVLEGGVAQGAAAAWPEVVEDLAQGAADPRPLKLPPERIPVLIRQAKNLYTQGMSWAEIAKQWNAQGIPTLSGIGQWHGATVARLVRNE
jgi:recombinase